MIKIQAYAGYYSQLAYNKLASVDKNGNESSYLYDQIRMTRQEKTGREIILAITMSEINKNMNYQIENNKWDVLLQICLFFFIAQNYTAQSIYKQDDGVLIFKLKDSMTGNRKPKVLTPFNRINNSAVRWNSIRSSTTDYIFIAMDMNALTGKIAP